MITSLIRAFTTVLVLACVFPMVTLVHAAQAQPQPGALKHPLDPLTATEIDAAATRRQSQPARQPR